MSSKYYRNSEGEPVECVIATHQIVEAEDNVVLVRGGGMYLACCDCGLVHYLAITRKDAKKVNLHFWRDHRRTAQLRRREYGGLHHRGLWKLVRR